MKYQTEEYGSFQQDLGCAKAKISGAGALNSYQVRIKSHSRHESNKIHDKNIEIEIFEGRLKCKILEQQDPRCA